MCLALITRQVPLALELPGLMDHLHFLVRSCLLILYFASYFVDHCRVVLFLLAIVFGLNQILKRQILQRVFDHIIRLNCATYLWKVCMFFFIQLTLRSANL
jgi:hypothetical protein